ncbi:site-specific DNA-methyltransferase [Candidatus Pacearchaeota archaeon]|nr:site-specific DNA-methyltransferase [Candidatus Pacearchaeota archaeon]
MENKVIYGDCLNEMKNIDSNSIDLIYIDPPFFTQREHSQKTRDNSKEFKFSDKWKSLEEYLTFIKDMLIESKRILKDTGSLFLHCDKTASHRLRCLLDDVFDSDNFVNEIVWSYKRWSNGKKGLLNSHQTIYLYGKTKEFKFKRIYGDYSPTTNIDQILQDRTKDSNGKSQYKKDKEGNIVIGKEKLGVPLTDVWDIPFLNPKANERAGYPTQKPLLLLERIINICTDEGDIVLDPVCGSGTTLVASKLLKRKYIGIDISKEAIDLTKKRLENPIKTESRLLEVGIEDYKEKSETEIAILKSLDATIVQRNKGIDGFLKKYYKDKPVSIKIQKSSESLEEAKRKLIEASKTKECKLMILIKTNNVREKILDKLNQKEDDVKIINSYELDVSKILSEL